MAQDGDGRLDSGPQDSGRTDEQRRDEQNGDAKRTAGQGPADGPRPDAETGRAAKRRTRLRTATWSVVAAVLTGTIINSLTGVVSTGARTVWSQVAGGEPVVVHSAVWTGWCSTPWVVPEGQQISPTPKPTSQVEEIRAWARARGAVRARRTTVELTIRGGSSTAVVLQELRVRVVDRRRPVRGTLVVGRCGGRVTPRLYGVSLDAARPVAVAHLRPGPELPRVTFPYKVTHSDPEVIRLLATTQGCDCRWVIELVYVDGEQRHVMRIDNDGTPFRTTAVPPDQRSRGR